MSQHQHDFLQELSELLTYAIKQKDWNSVDDALELINEELGHEIEDDDFED